jgi:hypothetical protein
MMAELYLMLPLDTTQSPNLDIKFMREDFDFEEAINQLKQKTSSLF